MSQVGFREETSDTGLPPPESSTQPESLKPEMPKVPPPRPKSITSPTGALPPPPSRPTPPGRPRHSEIKNDEGIGNLIDLSVEPEINPQPVPKPRPKPAPRVLSNNISPSNPASGEVTPNTDPVSAVHSPMRPTRPTIIRARPTNTEQSAQNDDESASVRLPSYIKTTASNDASVNELKAAFQKRQSGISQPVSKPKPKPKPNIMQKPTKPVTDTNNTDNGDNKTIHSNIASELQNDNLNTSPTPPSRRKRPTIIRPSTGMHNDTNSVDHVQTDNNKPLATSQSGNSHISLTSPEGQSTGVSAPDRPRPASRNITPTGLPKSVSADELRSSELSLPPRTRGNDSITPPPRKRKTGPPRPSQRPLSGSQSSSSISEKVDSTEKVPKTSPPTRPPSFPSSKPAPTDSSHDQTQKVPETSSRRVIIHEVYPQSEAPKLPPRPGPGHPLFHYMMDCPYGIAVATNDYQSLQTDELSFNEGDLIVLLKQVDSLWFYGKNGGIEGIFPANFVKVVEPLSSQGTEGHVAVGGASASESASLLLDLSSEIPDTGSGPRCRARFDYDGEGEEDLIFEEGDIIDIVEHVANDWLRGKLKGRTGIFPSTFVEIIEDLPPTPADVSPVHFDGFEDYGSTTTAMFDFSGKDGELTFKTDDKITVISVVNSDWLYGETNGMKGQFPSAFISRIPSGLPKYVSPLKEQPVTESPLYRPTQKVEEPEEDLIETVTPGDEAYCIAIHSYPGQSAEDLPFKEADKIILLEWVNAEWLKGKLENSGKVGIFPADFVTIIKELKTPPPKANLEHKTKTKVKALYDFDGEDDTELKFKEGDIIDMSGDMSESDEWREGELGGRIGLFPVSFVEEYNS